MNKAKLVTEGGGMTLSEDIEQYISSRDGQWCGSVECTRGCSSGARLIERIRQAESQLVRHSQSTEKLALLCDAGEWILKQFHCPHPFDGNADEFIRMATSLGYKPRAVKDR